MDIAYQDANCTTADTSIYLKFEPSDGQTECLLVDAGPDVRPSEDLGSAEKLVGVLLTHPHVDHYLSLPAIAGPDIPIYTSSEAAEILPELLEAGGKYYSPTPSPSMGEDWATSGITDAIMPINDWSEVCSGVEARPIPVGHSPGASGFVLRIQTDDVDPVYALITGDASTESVTGLPGIPDTLPVDIDILVANVIDGSDQGRDELGEAVGAALRAATAGDQTFIASSSLVGVHLTYLLGHIVADAGRDIPVRPAGMTARLAEIVGLSGLGSVDPIPRYDDPDTLTQPGAITLAGPEDASDGTAQKVWHSLEQRSSATVIQHLKNEYSQLSGACSTHSFGYSRHLAAEDVGNLIDRFKPVHSILKHDGGEALKDHQDTISWRTYNPGETLPLYGDSSRPKWQSPPWLGDRILEAVMNQQIFSPSGYDPGCEMPVLRRREFSLAAEGVQPARIEKSLNPRP